MKNSVICIDLKGNKKEINTEKLIWRPSVYGVLIKDGKLLMSKQWDGYDFPGGGAEIWETIQETAEREFFEETGITVKAKEVFHIETSFFDPSHSKKHKGKYWNCPLIYCVVEKNDGELSVNGFDEDEKEYADMPEWLDIKDIKNIKFINSADSVKIIEKALKFLEK